MPLVECKQDGCTNMVAGSAPTCPICGVTDPAVSYQEESLLRDIELQSSLVESAERLFQENGGDRWLPQLLNSRINNEYRERAEGEREKKRQLEDKLNQLRAKRL